MREILFAPPFSNIQERVSAYAAAHSAVSTRLDLFQPTIATRQRKRKHRLRLGLQFLTWRRGIGGFLPGLRWLQAGILGDPFPRFELSIQPLTLLLQLVVRSTQLCYSLLSKQLFERPLFDVLLLVLLELRDEADSSSED